MSFDFPSLYSIFSILALDRILNKEFEILRTDSILNILIYKIDIGTLCEINLNMVQSTIINFWNKRTDYLLFFLKKK